MRSRIFLTLAALSCQPIILGDPGEAGGGPTKPEGASGAFALGGTPHSPSAGGAGDSADDADTGGSSRGGTPTGGTSTSQGGAGTDAGGGDGGDGGDAGESDRPAIPLDARVLFVIYDPAMNDAGQRLSTTLGVEAPDVLALRLIDQLETLTNGHVHHEVFPFRTTAFFPPMLEGFRYDAAGYQACLADSSHCHAAAADYDAIQLEQDLCSSVQEHNADLIWLLGAERFGFMTGSQLSCQVLEDEQTIAKTLDVVSLDYSRGMASMLFSYQAHATNALQHVFGYPPANSTAEAPDNTFGLFAQARGRSPDITASGCGDITFAPNTLEPNRFDHPFTMPSYCDTFLHYPRTEAPLAAAVSTDCTAWGCTEVGFRGYWLSHLPRAPWSDSQGKLNDFWRYILLANERLPPPEVSVTCSSSYLPGWCQHVMDNFQGDCKTHEWATATKSGGFVEFRFEPKRLVSGLQLFDRGCAGQVLHGHLEFSDGSAEILFGALEPLGKVPTKINFAAKPLSGLRVVIDESSGANPGFGEVTVASTLP
jgi:hypothetical protein